ncbi:DUF3857 domain-containing protein [Granulicella cerasi]|uniref:DUF3857 domain-containing protein n=1 Tax=Granulicella cerasi TaxID=741063 RepID=A0ABW1Z8E4_9BACT|nr:DUF3857 domain-containing protein [Granulicella cerasi]
MRLLSLSTLPVALLWLLSPLAVAQNAPSAPQSPSRTPASKGDALPRPTASAADAAKAAVTTAGSKDSYGAESFVVMKSSWVYSFNADGTGYRDHTVAVRLQSEASLRTFGVVSTQFASASEHVEMHYVRVHHPDGSVTETPVKDVIEQPEQVTREAPFYSDLKQAQLPVKNLRVGDTLEWEIRVVTTRAEAPNHFWGASSFIGEEVVSLDDNLELRVPASKKATVWTNPSVSDQPKVTTEGDTKIYHWHHVQLKATTGDEAAKAKKLKQEKVLTADEEKDDEEGKLPDISWTTFGSWAEVGAWYRSLEGQRTQPDDEVKAKAAELTKDMKTPAEKAQAIYAFVATNLRYIGVSFGVGRFQPHEAVDVLHNQYGDCKDKATLLIAMLRAAGFTPDAVLIGANIRINEAVPSPSAFNHAINRVKVGDEEVWLDSTQEVAPYKALLFVLRDKQALVIPDKGDAVLMKTPKDLPFPSIDTWTAKGSMNADGISESHIHMSFRSDNEISIREAIHSVAPAQYEEVGKRIMNSLGYSGEATHTQFSRPEDTSSPFTIDVDYHREKAGDWEHLKTIPQLAPVSLPRVDDKDPPTRSINLGAPATSKSSSEMKLPAGWTVELPEAIHQKAHWGSYDQTYRFDDGVVYSERIVQTFETHVPVSEWKAYKKWQDDCDLGFDRYIQLIRPGADGKARAAGAASGHVTAKETEDLVQQAFDAARKMDVKGAESLLKQAKEADPQARRLWLAYGFVAILRGKNNEAVENYRKELALYPNETFVYGAIAEAQWPKSHEDAIATMRQYTAADSTNANAWAGLTNYLFQDKQYAEAAKTAQKSIDNTPEDAKVELKQTRRLVLGNAQLKAGQNAEGEKTMLALLKETDDPGLMNDAAYSLADAKLDLPLDDEKVRLALKRMDEETQSWTLDENPATLNQKSSLLSATWDTMGWILYREGKVKEARTYILAGYMGQHHEEVRKHLDELDDALKQPHVATGRKAEQDDRTFPLGSYNGPKMTAEYRLLLSHGKVERDEPTTAKAVGGADGMLKAADFSKLFPEGSNAKLVRTGMVNCGSGKCEIVLEP